MLLANQFKFSESYPLFDPQDKASLQATVERLTVDIGVLRSDNMNLFEKIKFLEAFHRSNGGSGAAGGATGVIKVWQHSGIANFATSLNSFVCVL